MFLLHVFYNHSIYLTILVLWFIFCFIISNKTRISLDRFFDEYFKMKYFKEANGNREFWNDAVIRLDRFRERPFPIHFNSFNN